MTRSNIDLPTDRGLAPLGAVLGRSSITSKRLGLLVSMLALGALVAAGPAQAAPDACPNADLRKGAGVLLPDCRAYEQVSPPDKNGGEVAYRTDAEGVDVVEANSVAAAGDRAIFASNTEFADAQYGGPVDGTYYIATRTADGWVTAAVVPPVTPSATRVPIVFSAFDLQRSVLSSTALAQTTPPSDPDEVQHVYVRDNVFGVVSPFYEFTPEPVGGFVLYNPVGSRDASHLAFVSSAALTDDEVPSEFYAKVYERVAGETRLVSVRPDGTSADHAFLGSSGNEQEEAPLSLMGAVSSDGRHIFFNDSLYYNEPKELYRRSDGAVTVSASPSKRSTLDPLGVRTKIFRIASTDGAKVLFTSAQLLTDDANTGPARDGADLYRYDVDADELVDISATPGGDGARVLGVLGAGDDLDRVYYAASGQVGGQGSASGEPNLYLWENDGTPGGSTRFITTLSSSDTLNWQHLDNRWGARVTPDGGSLMFQSSAEIPGHENGGLRQVYLYSADTSQLACVSCNPRGDTPLGVASIPSHRGQSGTQRWEHSHVLSNDGTRVFFNTPDALVPRDGNGEIDPYMWEAGELTLLSSGTNGRPSFFYNASDTGDDAFIVTPDALVPNDIDDLSDMYDVRVGGGFPAPATPPSCADDECQGLSPDAPSSGVMGSLRLEGAGNVNAGKRAVLRVKRLTKAQRRRLARGHSISVRIRGGRTSTVRVVLRARLGKSWKVVARGSASSRRARTAGVRLRIGSRAQRRLLAQGSLRLSLTARAPGARPRSLAFRIAGTK
jgi:hypothetical protein